jgi:hypothetical protein
MLATWWVQATKGTTYWRCEVPARHLPGQALHLTWKDLKVDEEGCVTVPRQLGSTSIWQFAGNAARALVMAHQQEQGLQVLMEVDDNYLLPAPRYPGMNNGWRSKLDRTSEDAYSHQAHRKICRWVDGIICSTTELANQYEGLNDSIWVCPNSIDLDDYPEPRSWFGEDRSHLNVGYAGSSSHVYDIAIVKRALDWAAREPGVTVWSVGLAEHGWSFEHQQIPWTEDMADYRLNLRTLDIGLCPLKRSPWHDSKSDIKVMEYLLAGAVPVVQGDSPAYAEWADVIPSATTEKQWLRVVKELCSLEQSELGAIWQRGMDHLLEHKLIELTIDSWRGICRRGSTSTSGEPSTSFTGATSPF